MTNRELMKEKINRITELKANLDESDKKQHKFVDGELTEEEYAPIREQRKAWRAEINQLEAEIAALRAEAK